jgi:hypothetical protein
MAKSQYGIMLGDFLFEQVAKEYSWKGFVASDRPHPHPFT